jgi:pre-mRNA-splicing helicase BRR2
MSGKSGKPDLSGYNYGYISSLVLSTERSVSSPRRDKQPDGAPTSPDGRIDPKEMGSMAIRQPPKLTADRSASSPRRDDKEPDGSPRSGKSGKPDLTGYN